MSRFSRTSHRHVATTGPWSARDVAGALTTTLATLATIYAHGSEIAAIEAPTLPQREAGANLLLMAAAPVLAQRLRELAHSVTDSPTIGDELQGRAQEALVFLSSLPSCALRSDDASAMTQPV